MPCQETNGAFSLEYGRTSGNVTGCLRSYNERFARWIAKGKLDPFETFILRDSVWFLHGAMDINAKLATVRRNPGLYLCWKEYSFV